MQTTNALGSPEGTDAMSAEDDEIKKTLCKLDDAGHLAAARQAFDAMAKGVDWQPDEVMQPMGDAHDHLTREELECGGGRPSTREAAEMAKKPNVGFDAQHRPCVPSMRERLASKVFDVTLSCYDGELPNSLEIVDAILAELQEPSEGMLEAMGLQSFVRTQWQAGIQHIRDGGS